MNKIKTIKENATKIGKNITNKVVVLTEGVRSKFKKGEEEK